MTIPQPEQVKQDMVERPWSHFLEAVSTRLNGSATFSLLLLIGVLSWFSFDVASVAQAADAFSAAPGKTGKVVAAGFGFQNADSSSITVKTYDAESGEVLSDDTYDLDIKEDRPMAAGQPRERVFAGGVGSGADGLSEFTLRVYDAADGRFLWEGRLNLGAAGGSDMDVVRVAAEVRHRATVSKVSRPAQTNGQPYFVLRAVDPATGQLMWSDQFSTDGPGTVRSERISRSAVGMDPVAPQDIDFRIRMYDEAGHRLLWEDRVTSGAQGEGVASESAGEAGAGLLPGSSIVSEGRPSNDTI